MVLSITVSHPHGNPNSSEAALAFFNEGWLSSFMTGVVSSGCLSRSARFFPNTIQQKIAGRLANNGARAKRHVLWELLSTCGKRIHPAGLLSRVNWYDVLFCGHDRQVSFELERNVDAVYCYEDAAKWTFGAAKSKQARTIYELPAGFYRGVANEMAVAVRQTHGVTTSISPEPEWKQRRKNTELELADVIVVPCRWARSTLNYSKLNGSKPVLTIPYGTPAGESKPRASGPLGAFTVLFAGQIGMRKGVPNLLAAWRRLSLADARLWLAGSLRLPTDYLSENSKYYEYLGALPRTDLLEVMKQADLFVLPSVAEGFGLVIGEAMACGVPVLTTTNTGGPELITDGVEGWCVPAHDVESLVERIEWAYTHRDELYQMGQVARLRAEQWTWADYRRKLIAELSPYLN